MFTWNLRSKLHARWHRCEMNGHAWTLERYNFYYKWRVCENERLKYIWLFVCSQQLYTIKTFALKTHKYQYTSLLANSIFLGVFFFFLAIFCFPLFRGFSELILFIFLALNAFINARHIYTLVEKRSRRIEFRNTSWKLFILFFFLCWTAFAIIKYKTNSIYNE